MFQQSTVLGYIKWDAHFKILPLRDFQVLNFLTGSTVRKFLFLLHILILLSVFWRNKKDIGIYFQIATNKSQFVTNSPYKNFQTFFFIFLFLQFPYGSQYLTNTPLLFVQFLVPGLLGVFGGIKEYEANSLLKIG